MDWLLKHNLIKQYLQKNFNQKEFKRAIKYTLIIGIQTLYQLHGNASTDPYVSFTLEQISSMIVSNNGTLNIQSDLPALNKCLKDIKEQLGDIQNELDTKNKTNTTSTSNSQKFVKNIVKPRPKPKPKNRNAKRNIKSGKNNITNKKGKVVKKADSKWRIGDSKQFKASDIYPNWWPEHNVNNDTNQSEEKSENTNDENEQQTNINNNIEDIQDQIDCNEYKEPQHPHIYNQPIAFSIPKAQFDKNEDNNNNIVQLHVNLYPEYMQKCLDLDAEKNEFEDRNKNKNVNNKKRHNSKAGKVKRDTTKSLTQCTESSQAKANGNKTQSQYLKSDNRNIAPCLKHKKSSNSGYNNTKQKNKKKKKGKKTAMKRVKRQKYENVESRIKNELIKDRERNMYIQNEKEILMRDIAKYGLDEHKNDEYYEEWKAKFGYNRLSKDDITKPSAISVADAMMKSDIMTAINPSFNTQMKPVPILITENDDIKTNDSMNFLTDLREWATSLTTLTSNEVSISE